MSGTEALQRLRRLRRIEITILISGMLLGAVAVAPAVVIVAIMVWSLRLNVRTVRIIERANRPRPDYSLIAAMELPIWRRTFEHAGAPETRVPSPAGVWYHDSGTFEDDRRAIRALADKGRAKTTVTPRSPR